MCTETQNWLCGNCDTCIRRSFENEPRADRWSDKNKLEPWEVTKSSGKEFWFNCDKCPHEFCSILANVTKGQWCPYCCVGSSEFCFNYQCEHCWEKSFDTHAKSSYWGTRNNIESCFVTLCSNKPYWFECECGHDFKMQLNNIANNGQWCPYCSGNKLCDIEGCKMCETRSFITSPYADCWSSLNKKTPRQTFLNSHDEVLFDCKTCGHTFEKKVYAVNDGTWCPYCSIPTTKVCTDDECDHCYKRSFASHQLSKYWDVKKNKIPARYVTLNDNDPYWFKCDKNKRHNFKCSPGHINSGSWCPQCKHKTEALLKEFLQEQGFKVKTQKKFKWCKNPNTGRMLPFDFYLPDDNIIIELDGAQHFRQVSNWKAPEKTLKNDVLKMKAALQHNIHFIRILQEDVFFNRTDWQTDLLEMIEDKQLDEDAGMHFVAYIGGNEYNNHKKAMK